MNLFDSHIHLQRLNPPHHFDAAVKWALVPAITRDDWEPLLHNYGHTDGRYIALGVHPEYAEQWNQQAATQLEQLVKHPRVVAIGEVGLDSNYADDLQQQVLRQQIKIALTADKALILHCYKRYAALLDILHEEQAHLIGGIVHGYTGSLEIALQLWQLGFVIGIGRTILNPHARRIRATVKALPDAAYVIESDAPWSAHILEHHPDMNQGAGALLSIAAQIAELRGQSLEQVACISANNAQRILHIESK